MSAPSYVIGIDCSTTATKAVVWDRGGDMVAEGRSAFPLLRPQPGWHEQNAEEWWQSTIAALREAVSTIDSRQVGAIGITHQRESFVCVNEDGRPLRPAILWLDYRCVPQIRRYGTERIHSLTGKVPAPTPALYKLYWLKEHEPDILRRAAKIVDVHGFLVHRFTNNWRTSWASADPMGLMDMEEFDWSDEILSDVGIERNQLCELVQPGTVVGELASEVAGEVGLTPGLPVVAGAGDGQTAGLGANITSPGRAYLNLGTAIVSGAYSDDYAWGKEFRTMSGPIPGTYTMETLLSAGTYIISWFSEQLADIQPPDLGVGLSAEQVFEAAATHVPPGSEGLFILPYWNGSQSPFWDAMAQGVAFGLHGRHGKAHIFRAILEGIAFEQRLMTENAESALGQPVERFLAMGGGSRSPLWCQIIADVTQRPVSICRHTETTSLGAAMFAATVVEWFPSLKDAATGMSDEIDYYEPGEDRVGLYDQLYTNVYKELYERLAPLFAARGIILSEEL